MNASWANSEAFHQVVAQFNARQFFDCHETIEDDLWRPMAEGPDKTFLQGLLQVGVGFYHLQNGNYTGAKNLLAAGLGKLRTTQGPHGLDWPRLIQETTEALSYLLDLGPAAIGAFPMERIPRIHPA